MNYLLGRFGAKPFLCLFQQQPHKKIKVKPQTVCTEAYGFWPKSNSNVSAQFINRLSIFIKAAVLITFAALLLGVQQTFTNDFINIYEKLVLGVS